MRKSIIALAAAATVTVAACSGGGESFDAYSVDVVLENLGAPADVRASIVPQVQAVCEGSESALTQQVINSILFGGGQDLLILLAGCHDTVIEALDGEG